MKKANLFCVAVMTVISLFLATTLFAAETKPPVEKKPAPIWEDANTYRIGAGDILEVITWKEPDFTREVTVRVDGKFTFPLLDDIKAAGRTPMEVKAEIQTRLKEFIQSPFVTVIVKVPGSQKFYILGEVAKTGEYILTKDVTVLQAFALAGGFTEWASKTEIIVFRKEKGVEKIIHVNYKDIVRGRGFEQNVKIIADDTIIVP
jgi:polysaccharide export outer membrane protein